MNITFKDLSLTWSCPGKPDQTLFADLNAHFQAGAVSLITGATGSGKSTLLHLLAGLLRPTAGTIVADTNTVSRWPAPLRDRWRRNVGICFQQFHLPKRSTVMDAVVQPLIPRNMSWTMLNRKADVVLANLDLTDLAHWPIFQLSGGQQQRVALARATVHQPDLLLLDEPTAFQDDVRIMTVVSLMATAAQRGACVVVSSHDPRLSADPIFQTRFQLNHGRLEMM